MLSAVCILIGGCADPGRTTNRQSHASASTPSIVDYVQQENLEKVGGFLTLYRNVAAGKLFLEMPENGGPDLFYQAILTSGFGSRDLADDDDFLDRGRFGKRGLVAFRRFGKRVLLIERNQAYYTPSSTLAAFDDAGLSFPNAVIAGFDVTAEGGGNLLVDATDFFLGDGIDIPAALKNSHQGKYSLDPKLGVVDVAHAHTTTRSIEVDALLTFDRDVTSDEPTPKRDIISRVAVDRSAILVRERHALIQLPDMMTAGFRPRIFDPRSGFFDNTYLDPARLPNGPMRQSFIKRFALSKKNPTDAVSEPERPIVFYIDPAFPPALQPLIREAVDWWNPAFAAAGFKDAIQVKELPPGVDLFDQGVNVILWMPRETRGFSIGGAVSDPRTGEVLKAIVRIDAMRLQADRLLFDALTSPYTDHPDLAARDETLQQRFRLLVAHEIGHTLGLRHQYIASAQGMSSVMDYPFPNITLDRNGAPVLRDAFPQAVGAWDKAAIFYGYHPFPADQEAAALRALIEANEHAGLYWMTDDDTGDANPLVQKWDRGTDPVAELEKVLVLRNAALARFSKYAIPDDEPLAILQDALAPLYLLHQFEVRAVASMLAGYSYRYAMRDGVEPQPVPASRQRQALAALLATLETRTLWPDQHVLELMSPRPQSYPASSESFSGDTGQIFDVLRPVEYAVAITMAEILQPRRAARLAQARAHGADAPGLDEVLAAVVARTWKSPPQRASAGAAQRAIALAVLRSLLASATAKTTPMAVRGACLAALEDIANAIKSHPPAPDWKDADAFATRAITAASGASVAFPMPEQLPLVLDPMGAFTGH